MSLQPVFCAAAAWDFLGLESWEEEGRAPSCKTTAGSDHPTSASHLPMLWEMTFLHEMSFHYISSYETMGPYSHSMLLSKIIVVMNASVRGCAVPGRGGTDGYINPLDVIGFTPGVCFTAP